jgi:hypothetical protein
MKSKPLNLFSILWLIVFIIKFKINHDFNEKYLNLLSILIKQKLIYFDFISQIMTFQVLIP